MSSDNQSAKLDSKQLDTILETMVETVTQSKDQIFEIAEQSRSEYNQLLEELSIVKKEIQDTINHCDKLEKQARVARSRLAEVSKHFQRYSEEDIRNIYEKTNRIQVELSIVREQEKQLRKRRDEMDRRIGTLQNTADRADALVGQTGVVLEYLTGDLKQISELVEDARQKQEFGLRIIEAQEEERKRISREIHDGPAQLLAHVLIGSQILERVNKEQGSEASSQEILKLRHTIRDALYEVRRIIYDLRPMSLDDLGLIPTLEKYLARIKEQYPHVTINYRTFGTSRRLPAKMEAAVFRLVQEGVQNACRHAEADTISVLMEFRSNSVSLIIKDNGVGFDTGQKKENSFGLLGMHERVEVLEGKIEIRSILNKGTSINIQIPILREE